MKPTPEQIAEVQRQIKVMQDWCDGKQIQHRAKESGPQTWYESHTPQWNWAYYDYRTKPEPRTVFVFCKQLDQKDRERFDAMSFNPDKTSWVEFKEVLP